MPTCEASRFLLRPPGCRSVWGGWVVMPVGAGECRSWLLFGILVLRLLVLLLRRELGFIDVDKVSPSIWWGSSSCPFVNSWLLLEAVLVWGRLYWSNGGCVVSSNIAKSSSWSSTCTLEYVLVGEGKTFVTAIGGVMKRIDWVSLWFPSMKSSSFLGPAYRYKGISNVSGMGCGTECLPSLGSTKLKLSSLWRGEVGGGGEISERL